MYFIRFLTVICLLFFWTIHLAEAATDGFLSPVYGDRQHIVYFEGTPQELEIYKIYGRQEGPTIMIMGGIQGDEPGGFLSADLYVDLALKRGNLIVVPRANFKSIILYDRGPDGDMNRKFDGVLDRDPDRDTVEIIKNLMAESDLFLNLHDGSGFFRTVWESDMANPSRYGQSIIADAEVYTHQATGRVIHLGQEARRAIDIINRDIPEDEYKFHFSNHDTLNEKSSHKEQRKSASYYALTKLGIPSYGLETSKQLPSLEMKIHQHNLAVNAFMEIYGVVPEQPRINLEPATLSYLVISVNGRLPVAVADGQTLLVNSGDTVEVVHIGANYDRGLTVDIMGQGGLNDIRLPLVIEKPTTIIARRDNVRFGEVSLNLLPKGNNELSPQLLVAKVSDPVKAGAGYLPGQPLTVKSEPVGSKSENPALSAEDNPSGISAFILEVDGEPVKLLPEATLSVSKGSKVKLVDIESRKALPPGTVMNLRGFVGREGDNSGNDKGTTADMARDMLPRFSLTKDGLLVYQLGAENGRNIQAKAYLRVLAPKLKSVHLGYGGRDIVLSLGGRITVKPGQQVTIKKINLEGELPLNNPRYTLGGHSFPTELPQVLTMPSIAVSLAVFVDDELAGKVVLVPGN